jgi:MscS family membrane protein
MAVPLNDLIGSDLVDLTSVDALDPWAHALIAVVVVLLAAVFTQRVVLGLVRKVAGQTQGSWDDDLVDVVSSRILFSVIVSVVQVCLLWLQPVLAETTQLYANATLILLAASALSATVKVVLKAFLDSMQSKRSVKVEGSNPLLVFLARGVVWAAAILLVAEQLNLDLSGILASLAVFSIILGLAVQHTLGNIMNSFMLSLDRPFDNGDKIIVDNIEGTVMAMGMLSTKILTLEEELVVIPNNTLVSSTITNLARGGGDGQPRRVVLSLDIGVDYDEKTPHVKHTLLRVANDSDLVLKEPKPHVEFIEMSDFAKVYRLYVWLASFADLRSAKDQLLTEIDAEFEEEGIIIPYPVSVEMERKPVPSDEMLSRKRARQHAAAARMQVIDRRVERQRKSIREEINTLNQRLEDRISSRERKDIEDEIGRLESLLSGLDLD